MEWFPVYYITIRSCLRLGVWNGKNCQAEFGLFHEPERWSEYLQPSGSHVSLKPLESGGAVSGAEVREQVDASGVDLGIQEDSTATAQESAQEAENSTETAEENTQVSENSTATAKENTETLPTYPQPKQTQSSVTELETLLAMEAQNQLQQLVATEKAQEDEKKSEQEQQELQKLEQQELQKLEQQELKKLEQQELQKLEQQELKKLEQQELKELEQKVAQQEQEIAQQELQKLEEQEVAQQELQNLEQQQLLEQSALPIADQKSDSLLVLIPNDDQSTDEFSSATSSTKITSPEHATSTASRSTCILAAILHAFATQASPSCFIPPACKASPKTFQH